MNSQSSAPTLVEDIGVLLRQYAAYTVKKDVKGVLGLLHDDSLTKSAIVSQKEVFFSSLRRHEQTLDVGAVDLVADGPDFVYARFGQCATVRSQGEVNKATVDNLAVFRRQGGLL